MRSSSPAEAGEFRVPVPYEELALEPFRALPDECWSAELYFADCLVDAVVDRWCQRTLETLGLPPGTRIDGSDEKLVTSAGVAPSRRDAFWWLVRKLEIAGLIAAGSDGAGTVAPSPWTRAALATARAKAEVRLGSTFELIDVVGASYPDFLRGTLDGPAILLNRAGIDRWERYFHNGNLAYAPINRMGAALAADATRDRRLRVLELGGGFGSGAEALLERVGSRTERYWFTELSPLFLSRGRARLAERFGEVDFVFRRVDLNLPLEEQGIPAASFDLVYAINTLHAVRDLRSTLEKLRTCLAPDGKLVVGEGIRPRPDFPVPIEFVFQLTREFSEFEPDPHFRPRGGFLYFEHWRTALARSGFTHVELWPDPEAAIAAYPRYSLAAIVADPG